MRIITDTTAAGLPGGTGPGEPWAAVGADGALWAALGGGGAPRAQDPPASLATGFWATGFSVASAPVSQYDELRRLAAAGRLPAGHVFCAAGSGRGFHGQHGRVWLAAAGNVHLCAALAADLPVAGWGPALPALPALAVLDAVRQTTRPDVTAGIKWVNDVLLDEAKVGGVLTAVRAVDGRIERVFLGMGLNVAVAPPPPDGARVACLAEAAARPVRAGDVAVAILAAVEARWSRFLREGPVALLDDYRRASLVMGRRVVVAPEPGSTAPVRAGVVLDIGDDLSLRLDDGDEPVTGGRLVPDHA